MNKLDFTTKAGWPGSSETFEFLQNMILAAQLGAYVGGKYWIVEGCIENGGNISDGTVFIDGEILHFVGGVAQSDVIVVDNATDREYFGGENHPYYHERMATFGTGAGAVAWSSFHRNDPDKSILGRINKMEKMLAPLMPYEKDSQTQYGSWLFWGRPVEEIPDGWEPVPDEDWKGRMPVVLNTNDVDFNTVGKTGGEKKHTLTIGELPSHNHSYITSRNHGSTASGSGTAYPTQETTYTSGNAGGNQAHNNMPPYKVVMFIRFVG